MDPLCDVGKESLEVGKAIYIIDEERMFDSHVIKAFLYSGGFLVAEKTNS
jgi:hypothetical protein